MPSETPIVEQVAGLISTVFVSDAHTAAVARTVVALVGEHIAQQIEAQRLDDPYFNEGLTVAARIAREARR